MKLTSLSLTHFRGFKRVEIDFHERVNVIAGINGVGKSSVLHGLRIMFSRSMPEMTLGKGAAIPLTDEDIAEGQPSRELGAKFVIHGEPASIIMQRGRPNEKQRKKARARLTQIPLEITVARRARNRDLVYRLQEEEKDHHYTLSDERDIHQLLLQNILTDAQFLETENERALQRTGGLNDVEQAEEKMLSAFKNQSNQPIMLYYAPLRSEGAEVRNLPDGSESPLGVARAFDKALQERDASFRDFIHWYRWLEQNDDTATKRQRNALLRSVQKAVNELIPEFTALKLEEKPRLRFMVNKAGQWLSLSQLSDGERGLLGLVFDLTRRLVLANPERQDPVGQGEGIVLIDELELHLHPNWQRRVLERLTTTFSACQFIVTSHSPQVIGEVKNDGVRFLEKDQEGDVMCWTPDQTIGLDANMILDLMGADSINQKIQSEIKSASRLVNQRQFSEARVLLNTIKESINGTNSEIIRLEAAIKFLGIKNDQNK